MYTGVRGNATFRCEGNNGPECRPGNPRLITPSMKVISDPRLLSSLRKSAASSSDIVARVSATCSLSD